MKYDVDYFIRKFQAIPEEKWCEDDFDNNKGAYCALGHCGITSEDELLSSDGLFTLDASEEGLALYHLLPDTIKINDCGKTPYHQPTAKQRILAALYDIKKLQDDTYGKTKTEPTVKVIHHYVSVSESIVNQSKELILQ